MKKGLLYIHGKGGTAREAEHYRPLFPDCDVTGLDYRSRTPWEARDEFRRFFDAFGHPLALSRTATGAWRVPVSGDPTYFETGTD